MSGTRRQDLRFRNTISFTGVLLIGILLNASPTDAQQAAPQTPPDGSHNAPLKWTAELKRQLERECQEGGGCFAMPLGAKVGGLIPLAEVTDAEKSEFWSGWKRVLQAEYFPSKPGKVEWRKMELTKVHWAPRKPGERNWGGPKSDWICARWEEGGHRFIAIDLTLTLSLTGATRIPYRHPTREEVSPDAKEYFLESHMDKAALLNILITFFRVPWVAETDFVVRWSMAAPSPDSLRIRSALFQKETDPPHWRDWYDDFSFELSGTDPQYMTFGFWVPPKK